MILDASGSNEKNISDRLLYIIIIICHSNESVANQTQQRLRNNQVREAVNIENVVSTAADSVQILTLVDRASASAMSFNPPMRFCLPLTTTCVAALRSPVRAKPSSPPPHPAQQSQQPMLSQLNYAISNQRGTRPQSSAVSRASRDVLSTCSVETLTRRWRLAA